MDTTLSCGSSPARRGSLGGSQRRDVRGLSTAESGVGTKQIGLNWWYEKEEPSLWDVVENKLIQYRSHRNRLPLGEIFVSEHWFGTWKFNLLYWSVNE